MGIWLDECICAECNEKSVPEVSETALPPPTVVAQKWYNTLRPEPIEVMEAWTHLSLHRQLALKYLARAGLKGSKEDHIKDLEKAIAYLTRERNLVRDGKAVW